MRRYPAHDIIRSSVPSRLPALLNRVMKVNVQIVNSHATIMLIFETIIKDRQDVYVT